MRMKRMNPVDPCIDPKLLPENSKAIVFGVDQKGVIPLPTIQTPELHIISRWQLTDIERRKIFEGEDLYLTVVAQNPPPVYLSVGVVNWK